jgi:ATP-dependent exoDNAse (exonuclease V) beta subunit
VAARASARRSRRVPTRLEASLAQEIEGELATIAGAFPAPLARLLPRLQRYAVANADGATRIADIASNLVACADANGVPAARVEALDDWRALASWLLVAVAPQFRQAVNKLHGFPPRDSGPAGEIRGAHIDAMEAILAELSAVSGLAEALDAARHLPPSRYSDDAWSVVSALLDLLPSLAARLTLVFRDTGSLDFTQGMLGAPMRSAPRRRRRIFLLSLDLRIDHLPIDEFQDTSFTQLELLRRLTAGWEQGDGRTLFAVGDPMQSIYRFREAEVRISSTPRRSARSRACPSNVSSSRAISARMPESSCG